jgi:hypothetical protein
MNYATLPISCIEYTRCMMEFQGNCEILTEDKIIVGKSAYCTIKDLYGTMNLSTESAGKLWIVQNLEKKELSIKLYTYGKVFKGKINIMNAPTHQENVSHIKMNFKVIGELKQTLL